jgi:formylmethanofuran dehydrogenase subunit E-like metal-binding protein
MDKIRSEGHRITEETFDSVEKSQRQRKVAEEARRVVEETFASISLAQKDILNARISREAKAPGHESNLKELAQEFEKRAAKKITSTKSTRIYNPDNSEKLK